MDGHGSRTWARDAAQPTTEVRRAIDVRHLHRIRALPLPAAYTITWSRAGRKTAAVGVRVVQERVLLAFGYRSTGGEGETRVIPVALDWTTCHYGGRRPWFLCPRCSRRVAVLYLSGRYFDCRHCAGLVHSSKQERQPDRALRREQAIRMRLGGTGSTFDPFPPKPKRMRWDTYFRLWARSVGARNAWSSGMTVQLDRQARRGARVAEQAERRGSRPGNP